MKPPKKLMGQMLEEILGNFAEELLVKYLEGRFLNPRLGLKPSLFILVNVVYGLGEGVEIGPK